MLGEIYRLADNLWYIAGEMPADAMKEAESANAVFYLAGDRGYLTSGITPAVCRCG